MALSYRQISEIALILAEHYDSLRHSWYSDLATKLEAVVAGMERLRKCQRRLQICTRRKWLAAATEVTNSLSNIPALKALEEKQERLRSLDGAEYALALPRDDEEFRKRITALAIAAEPLVLIDNISGTLGSPSLDAALTATSWSDRILGQTAMASGIPLFATWYATGNNVILAADTARRTLHIRLESPLESPEERAGFRHPALLAWIRQERGRLAVAPVTILAAYCAAGRPDMGLRPWGSFEAWSGLVRQAVVWVGMPDPAETRS